ncbi:MAG: hypothetical protein GEU71_03515 [Actinobacteria bacterium]|nr:hypothetical protein [Actinomycetota bacterium]
MTPLGNTGVGLPTNPPSVGRVLLQCEDRGPGLYLTGKGVTLGPQEVAALFQALVTNGTDQDHPVFDALVQHGALKEGVCIHAHDRIDAEDAAVGPDGFRCPTCYSEMEMLDPEDFRDV